MFAPTTSIMPSDTKRRVGAPRLDKYERLIARMYEALILLWIEQPIQGPHATAAHDDGSLIASQRRLTTNLAYICDAEKGGRTTTAIAIEDFEEYYRFWIASNQGVRRNSQMSSFLKATLQRLQNIARQPNPSAAWLASQADSCARACAAFAAPRIKQEARMLSSMIKTCIEQLKDTRIYHGNLTDTDVEDLNTWLLSFQFEETLTAYDKCMISYNARNNPQMDILRRLGQEVASDSSIEPLAQASRRIRHFVGRLAEHIRVSKQLVEDALRVGHVLDVFQVAEVEAPPCVQPPQVDSHTNLDGILNRMIPSKTGNLPEIQAGLSRLENHVGIESQIKEQYRKMQITPPIVHCEVQVLNHFYRKKLRFAGGDHFVGCSKFSCFCCKLYFRHHPSRPVEPGSHQQVYLNWGPAALPNGSYDPLYQEDRDILNLMIRDIRDAFFKIMIDKVSAFSHPNSITGITRSADGQDYNDSKRLENNALDDPIISELDSDDEGGALL